MRSLASVSIAALLLLAGVAAAHARPARGLVEVRLPKDGKGPHPTVLINHGWLMGPKNYEYLADHLTQKGYAVALIRQPDNRDLDPDHWVGHARRAIDVIEKGNANPKSGYAGRIDMKRLGIIGHSLGGATAIGTAARDPRIKAVLALAPGTAIQFRDRFLGDASKLSVPTLVMGGGEDLIASPAMFGRPATAVCAHCKLEVLPTANHLNFSAPGFTPVMPTWFGPVELALHGDTQREIVKQRATEWFAATL